jgi:hypothetical protein
MDNMVDTTPDASDSMAGGGDQGATSTQDSAPVLAKKDCNEKLLDLAFAMDCTGSMGSYIQQVKQNIRNIVEEIVSKEKADVRLALVEYRDHKPQDSTFVTRVNDFSPSVKTMKGWLEQCSAAGGGDAPEAVADALHAVLKLDWRPDAVKICVFVSDAPPHGLGASGDGFPNGCPDGLDPMVTTNELAQKGVTLYLVGCEPSINPYKEFFSAIAHLTGGQYVPLKHAKLLANVIIGGAAEELSLKELMAEVEEEVLQEAAAAEEIDEEGLSTRIHEKMKSRGIKSKRLLLNQGNLPKASAQAQGLSYCTNMADVRSNMPKPQMKSYSTPPPSMMRKKSASKSRSFLASIPFFGRKNVAEDAAALDAMDVPAAAPAHYEEDAAFGAPCEDSYELADDNDIEHSQVSRMVQKAIMANNMRSKVRSKPSAAMIDPKP